jgi:hypothetical protein
MSQNVIAAGVASASVGMLLMPMDLLITLALRVCETIREGSGSNSDLVQKGVVVWKGDDEVWAYQGKLNPGGGYQRTVVGQAKTVSR